VRKEKEKATPHPAPYVTSHFLLWLAPPCLWMPPLYPVFHTLHVWCKYTPNESWNCMRRT
jgi:hypothetical protein